VIRPDNRWESIQTAAWKIPEAAWGSPNIGGCSPTVWDEVLSGVAPCDRQSESTARSRRAAQDRAKQVRDAIEGRFEGVWILQLSPQLPIEHGADRFDRPRRQAGAGV